MAVIITQGALRAMTEGTVSEDWAKHHHGLWADEQLQKSPTAANTDDAWAKGKLKDPQP
jgi:cytochrome b subunit of formate dehydrogenase